MRLGTCYYPEHWTESWWADDARRMAEMGLTRVRIGEFAWSRIEPERGCFDWSWLDRAIETLAAAGLGIILGTPTATPPKWLVETMPDMLALDAAGQVRGFGSRRHYCFSHQGYRAEAARITTALAARYGQHPAIVGWQTDNEYGCHDTAISFSGAAAAGFRDWLAAKYRDVAALNTAWGNVFWSMDYPAFKSIDPPNLTVTEPNPAHVLDWRRYSSDSVVSFNRAQADIIRAYAPDRDIFHNFMGFFTQFDHHAVGRDLDVVGWDSYPLGFLEQFWFSEADKLRYARQGHPDIAAFHHDLYRGCAKNGRWCVLEQQPGPVNWARYNPAPLPGMVTLWTLEAMAHGAELVSYFRWRQAPFGQEQMHAGLLRPDSTNDVAGNEVRAAAVAMAQLGDIGAPPKSVALIFSYEADWMIDTAPQGQSFRYLELAFEMYSGLRKLGLDVDIVSPDAALDAYKMVVVPSLPLLDAAVAERLATLGCPVLLGPRSGSKTCDFAIPENLAPGPLQAHLPLQVVRVESLRPGLHHKGDDFVVERWLEHIESALAADISTDDGIGIVYRTNHLRYLGAWPDQALLRQLYTQMAQEGGIQTQILPYDVRLRRCGDHVFAFNYGTEEAKLGGALTDTPDNGYSVGSAVVPAAGVSVWRSPPSR